MTAAPRVWVLAVVERPEDGRLEVDGLPAGRAERQSVVYRLRDTLAAVSHADDIDRQGQGRLWRRYASDSYRRGWLGEVTVVKGRPSTPVQ